MSDVIVGENATNYVDVGGELILLSTFVRGRASDSTTAVLTPAKARELATSLVAAADEVDNNNNGGEK